MAAAVLFSSATGTRGEDSGRAGPSKKEAEKKKAKETADTDCPKTPERPTKFAKKSLESEEKPLATPTKSKGLPKAVNQRRPADFGRAKPSETVMLMQAGTRQLVDDDVDDAGKNDDPEAAADQACTLADGSGQAEPIVSKKKKHSRSCKAKPPSDDELKAKATSLYLASIELTWPAFQQMHTRLDVVKVMFVNPGPFCRKSPSITVNA